MPQGHTPQQDFTNQTQKQAMSIQHTTKAEGRLTDERDDYAILLDYDRNGASRSLAQAASEVSLVIRGKASG